MPKPEWKCETCVYWHDDNETHRDETLVSIGQCRRSPPTQGDPIGVWPHTLSIDWCGQWKEIFSPPEEVMDPRVSTAPLKLV
jgi:hypothetical protein